MVADTAPLQPYQTAAELVIRLGAVANIVNLDDDAGCPMVQITWGSITVLLTPHSASEGIPIAPCDVSVAGDLAAAARAYHDAMQRLWTRQSQQFSAPWPSGDAQRIPLGRERGDDSQRSSSDL